MIAIPNYCVVGVLDDGVVVAVCVGVLCDRLCMCVFVRLAVCTCARWCAALYSVIVFQYIYSFRTKLVSFRPYMCISLFRIIGILICAHRICALCYQYSVLCVRANGGVVCVCVVDVLCEC